jgi:hypothetical protein
MRVIRLPNVCSGTSTSSVLERGRMASSAGRVTYETIHHVNGRTHADTAVQF